MKKNIVYFVSYYLRTKDNSTGYGNVRITLLNPITKYAQVTAVCEWIKKDIDAKECTLINFIRLEE